ncbi:MAG: 1-deoxy-D-xylulose-5-phosphate synthase, partial [Bacteroidetes bacterium]|nr:1-deoxy-D-xylulose-5-phosphate synthase [Bacteroidota bacterium]
EELRNLMYTAQLPETTGPFSIRYPRGNGVMIDWKKPFQKIIIGKGRRIQTGDDIAIVTIGTVGNHAVSACKKLEEKGIKAAHYDMRFVKPLDEELLHEVFRKHSKVITVEDGCIVGGMGSAVLEFMADHNYNANVKRLGIPDKYIEHGEQKELYIECGYDADSIFKTVVEMVGVKKNTMTG